LFSGSGHGHHRDMSDSSRPQTPEHADLVADLKVLREKGLIRLRQLDLPALSAAALAAGLAAPDARGPRTQEEILRRAVEALGEEETGLAAAYLFGLVRGTIGWRTKDLRERAASFYGLSAESFRKEPEQLLIGRVAEEILRLCDTPNRPDSQRDGAQRTALTPRREGSAARDLLLRHMNRIMAEHSSGPEHPRATLTIGPLPMPGGPEGAEVTVYQGLMEELQGIDVLVSSENTFLELAKPFKSSLSAHLRRAAARRGPGGAVLDDIVDTELRAWVEAYGHPGLPVESGCVAPTSSGQLARRGVLRLYHAAIATPRPGTNDYDVDLGAIPRAVSGCFALGRQEREQYPQLRSICFPLLGAGRAGVDPAVSFDRIWPAVQQEVTADPSWEVNLCTLHPHETLAVLRHLYVALTAEPDLV
jgi:hypothetical protein